ncbi:MAG: cryptochrome/photolyase family protein [Alphaproteobacteria bacterium]|nr:cryptochrome/photolyase family protein [Alphaproteobacteria bacterium]
MTTLRVVLGDHLTRSVSALRGLNLASDVVLMIEAAEETRYVRHHRQKIVFVLSAMRHFAKDLRADGITVDYVELDDRNNTGSFTGEVVRAVQRHRATRVIVTEPGEWRVLEAMQKWETLLDLPVEIREDDRFFASRGRFARWANDRKALRMEYFYREMRREHRILMDGASPVGGHWNFDTQNRRSLPEAASIPKRRRFKPDAITDEVLSLVRRGFPDYFGDLESFGWAVTRSQALQALEDFIANGLPKFGDYQDAMKQDDPFVFHSALSPYLNVGLLTAREVCDRAESEYRTGRAPLNCVEGFIRQILGWREYVRGVYWHNMPGYATMNALGARRPLPSFYWSGDTDMNCLKQAIGDTRRYAYSHHIQRLMVTGNFALLLGVKPSAISEWYLAVYTDAFEWVELPNTFGMSQFADGGLLASKPYAASGAYIDRMSDFCKKCRFDVRQKSGADACPFNYLYWAFLKRNQERLQNNPRLTMAYRQLKAMPAARTRQILLDARRFTGLISRTPGRASIPQAGPKS